MMLTTTKSFSDEEAAPPISSPYNYPSIPHVTATVIRSLVRLMISICVALGATDTNPESN